MNKKFHSLLLKAAGVLEVAVAIIIIVVILVGSWRLIVSTLQILPDPSRPLDMNGFLSEALELIVGIEFIKMLLKHTPGAVVEVLLFAIAREIVVTHSGSLETLLGVIAVAVLFAVRRYLGTTKETPSIAEQPIDSSSSQKL